MARQQPAMPTNEEAEEEAEAEVATAPNQASRGSQATGNAPSVTTGTLLGGPHATDAGLSVLQKAQAPLVAVVAAQVLVLVAAVVAVVAGIKCNSKCKCSSKCRCSSKCKCSKCSK